jgi:hypothetical protein
LPIEEILEECNIEVYSMQWAQMNGLTYNNLDCEYYDIIDSNGVSYQLILSVYDAEQPKYVSLIDAWILILFCIRMK